MQRDKKIANSCQDVGEKILLQTFAGPTNHQTEVNYVNDQGFEQNKLQKKLTWRETHFRFKIKI